ncbi:MAG: hypothetical protein QN120_10355 [Armatimonadota bacterium]|nr:hypothetical protein [Armatimonadota bacterium]
MERDLLLRVIEDARRRLDARRAWRWGGRVAAVAAGVVLVLVLLRLAVPLALPYPALALAALGAGLGTVAGMRASRRTPPLLAAQVLDYRFGGADRIATAMEVRLGRHRPTILTSLLLDDATALAASLDLRRHLPAGPDRTAAVAVALAIVAVLAAGALKGLSLPGTPAREVARTIQREGRRLERAGQTMEEQARAERARIARRMAPSLQRLGEALQRERLERQEALARIESLGQMLEAERRQVSARREQLAGEQRRSPGDEPSDLFKQRVATDRALRQIRELADRLAESISPEEREAIIRQLAALAGGEDGGVPTRIRQQAEAARRQAELGDTAGARRSLQGVAGDLEDLRAMLADEEGLEQAQRDLRRSADQIARGAPGAPQDTEQAPQASTRQGPAAPGERPPSEGQGPEPSEVPAGPNQGTLPGQGAIAEKLGARTQRLEGPRQQSRIRGLQGEGRVATSELLGPGRPGRVRAPSGPGGAAARAEADRYVARMRVPPEYREIVRRYFEALAASR